MQSDVVIDLTDVTRIAFMYRDDDTSTETIEGTVSDATAGQATFSFTPVNTATHGVFEWYITVQDSDEGISTIYLYGQLILLKKAGTDIQGTLPTTQVVEITATGSTNCASSPITVEWTDHTKTYLMAPDLACDFEFNLPSTTSPTNYIGTWFSFVNLTNNICTVNAAAGDTIDDSAAGGAVKSVGENGTNPSDFSRIKIELVANNSGECYWMAVEGRRVWATTQ